MYGQTMPATINPMMGGIPPQPPPQQAPPQQPPPQQQESGTNTTLLSETRQQTTEVRLELTKLTTKIEDMANKIDKLREEGGTGGGALMSRGTSPNMETSVLLHNIQRIIQVSYYVCGCIRGTSHVLYRKMNT